MSLVLECDLLPTRRETLRKSYDIASSQASIFRCDLPPNYLICDDAELIILSLLELSDCVQQVKGPLQSLS